MKPKGINRLLLIANDKFGKQNYQTALFNYSLVLKESPNNKDARIGAILSEMAMSKEEGAQALFDYYSILKEENREEAADIVEGLIESVDDGLEAIAELFEEPLKSQIEYEDGILYGDFKDAVEARGDFKRAFEDVIFSTRVIISDRDDFIDFLENLIEFNFTQMALNYVEGALQAFPNDERIRELIDKLEEAKIFENSASSL